MATTYQAPPVIGVTAPDEDMDLLSDNGRMEQDQDLIDVDAPTTHNADDDFDFTIDDAASDRGTMPAHEDDEMLDEYDDGDTLTHEEVMQEDPQPDDELLDDASEQNQDSYADDSTYDLTAHGQQHDDTFVPAVEDHATHDDFIEDYHTDDAHQRPDPGSVTDKIDYVEEEEITGENVELAETDLQVPADETVISQPLSPEAAESQHPIDAVVDAAITKAVHLDDEKSTSAHHENDAHVQPDTAQSDNLLGHEDQVAQTSLAGDAIVEPIEPYATKLDEAVSMQPSNGANSQQSAEAATIESTPEVPTILVDYYGDEYSLFPPAQSLAGLSEFADYSYLLEDVVCFHKSIHDMLEECKHMLNTDIDEEQELELEIPALGFSLAQSSQDSLIYTMEQIATVFHTLNANDGLEDMQPLWVVLKSKTRFASRLAALQQAVNEQKGMSEVAHLLGLEDMDNPDQHDGLGIQHAIDEADYGSSEEAESEHADDGRINENAENEHVEREVLAAVAEGGDANGAQHSEQDHDQDQAESGEEQHEKSEYADDLQEEVRSPATSITLKEDLVDSSNQGQVPSDLQIVGVVATENGGESGRGVEEGFEQIHHPESQSNDVTADILAPVESATDVAEPEVHPGTNGTQIADTDDTTASQAAGDDATNNEELLTFEEEDKITFEDDSVPAPRPISETQATLTDDNIIDYTEEEAGSPQTGTKRSWDEHLDDDFLEDDTLESPKRVRHSDSAA